MFTKSRDGGGAAFSVAIDVTFSFVIAMVVSRLPAGCRVDASASCPLNSASAVTSAYQRPAASCPLAHFFPFAYVCWLVITSPHVAPPPPCIAFCCTAAFTSILDPPSSLVPAGCCVASCHTASASRSTTGSRVASCGTFALHSPARPLLHRNFHRPLSRSLGAAAIASILKCTAHSPGGGIANGHCFLLYGSRPPTRPPARRLACSLLRHLRLKFSSSPSLAPPLSSPPLSAPRPSPASSNARRTLPAAASPSATVPSCTALVIQHVHLRRHIVIFTAQPSTILAQLSSYLGGR